MDGKEREKPVPLEFEWEGITYKGTATPGKDLVLEGYSDHYYINLKPEMPKVKHPKYIFYHHVDGWVPGNQFATQKLIAIIVAQIAEWYGL